MRVIHLAAAAILPLFAAAPVLGADVNRRIIAEIDPVAPASAAYDEAKYDMSESKWGGLVDFNMGNVVSTGPEVWTGSFTVRGPKEQDSEYRREDFWPGERQKLNAVRLRWTITRWENPQSMRGWFMKMGYSYTRIDSRANRYQEEGGEGDAVPVNLMPGNTDEASVVTDLRHGVVGAFGNRWLLADQKISINLGCSFTSNFKRQVNVDGKDPNTRADYDALIESIPDTRMSVRPMPEANLGVGYAW